VTPTLILPLKHFPEDCIALAHRYHWSGQEEGWITEQIFRDWVIKVFIPHVQNRRQLRNLPEQPALLWLDGHSSRGSPEALQALIDANIITATIPAHTSHILQPLDCGVNRAMKQCMRTRRGRIKDDSTAGYRKSLLGPLTTVSIRLFTTKRLRMLGTSLASFPGILPASWATQIKCLKRFLKRQPPPSGAFHPFRVRS